ncbi:purine and uridine phosphorylase [Jaminaea rosea]|uniref:Purine and uridine phosphorylase n=1 Tax=Jaminaea rosea TaxID=1569628 RepID=A0A316UNN6_9BASI|nr:purine and uridine phosphorylase [Jaminaea rosea]PWN26388.1 purine and uridine phosphorylase [Jaminaea rosea]
MKDTLSNANFPLTSTGATYHLGCSPGQLANRIIIVGDFSRARRIAALFDDAASKQGIFENHSSRQFLTLTGTFHSTPVSVVAIGMGFPLVDFFLREARKVVQGEMCVIRLGSCGSLDKTIGLGSVVVPRRSHGVVRNYDWFHEGTSDEERRGSKPYQVTRGIDVEPGVHDALLAELEGNKPAADEELFNGHPPSCVGGVVNGSADSFYSSQGRSDPAFWDENEGWVEEMVKGWGMQTLEMETFVLQSLAHSANKAAEAQGKGEEQRVRTGAVQMIFANRHTSDFIKPQEVDVLERWAGEAVLRTLIGGVELHHTMDDGVWNNQAHKAEK